MDRPVPTEVVGQPKRGEGAGVPRAGAAASGGGFDPPSDAMKPERILCLFCAVLATLNGLADEATATQRQYLSGRDKDDAVRWDFFCTGGRNSGFWTNIAVPANWELQGFGAFDYGNVPMAGKSNEQGRYRHGFAVPSAWAGRRVHLVFEGVMTDTEVLVNGQSAGPLHQGGFYRFKYEVTGLVRLGATNLLEVKVSKVSANSRVEDAERLGDYWVFGGIYRPVYLEALPASFIDWTAVDARADGSFRLDVHLQGVAAASRATARVLTVVGQPVGEPFSAPVTAGAERLVTLRSQIAGVKPWSAETPDLYQVEVTLEQDGKPVHTVNPRFGFRTFEVRPGQGLFLNGARIVLQGANRHSFWPDSGRCLSRKVCYDDARLMKAMNMNAARMSHYPPDTDFLDACDELGLYVLDELAGWQREPYDTQTGKQLVRELVTRDVNHPSILFWDNGNEGGWNKELDAEFPRYDPQGRRVLHPWESNQGINTAHYRTFAEHELLLAGRAIPKPQHFYVPGELVLPTEFLHGLYDGGHGAGLRDYWRAVRASPLGAGGFLWALVDEGTVRADQGGRIDCAGNQAPDGIVGPYREKEGSYYAIQELWSPVQVLTPLLDDSFDGTLTVENQYSFTDLSQCRFAWGLVDFRKPSEVQAGHVVRASGAFPGPSVSPGTRGSLRLPLPKDWRRHDALMLTARDPNGGELWTWSWRVKSAAQLTPALLPTHAGPAVVARTEQGALEVTAGKLTVRFDVATGRLLGALNGAETYALSNGPRLAPAPADSPLATVQHGPSGSTYTVTAAQGPLRWVWKVHPAGYLELDCTYSVTGSVDYLGVTFDYPEKSLREKTWLGAGPYRVWKNRLQGVRTDVWRTAYNDLVPGQQWSYPEFNGYFRDFVWVQFVTGEGQFTVLTETPDLFLRVGTPQTGESPQKTRAAFPDGNLSFLHGIAPIGNKFHAPEVIGPESQPNQAVGDYHLRLWFVFGPR